MQLLEVFRLQKAYFASILIITVKQLLSYSKGMKTRKVLHINPRIMQHRHHTLLKQLTLNRGKQMEFDSEKM